MRGRRLILGYDGGCGACSALARRIEEAVGERLEVRSLYDPQVEHWREEALGKEAPWAPTLVEVDGIREVRAWTGSKIVAKLVRALGPLASWQVMRVLGEVGVSKARSGKAYVGDVDAVGISRGQFLKGLGGAALAFSFLSGTASPALAAVDEWDQAGLVLAFSVIEEIPNSVVARGDRAAREWVQRRAQQELQRRFNLAACAAAILKALASNAVPISKILKIRAAIKAFGGVRKFVAFLYRAYRYARSQGKSRGDALRYAAIRAYEVTGVDVVEALLDLFSLSGVAENCF
ncbi:hypothetical protein Rxycam_02106 [Rubrobacter xylanophilus DSM 9941]|uniref:hypothetical protein n=1 Tax=Rubrobacter xylanophilus TaxID=49319 RepID=UPI001C63EDD1|nr:hypothetical protein [Rubrobacter xylanophilus]QYJ16273.1 hypothetical protein Rxycam_02106 [Rubrobacter xylanophilus DSM 9941]